MSTSSKQTKRLFVYGTLMQGEVNHSYLRNAQYMGRILTKPDYELIDLGYFPALLKKGNDSVHGELYEVDEDTLHRIDRLEGNPHFYYRDTVFLDDDTTALTYFQRRSRNQPCIVISSGNWKNRSAQEEQHI